MMLLQSLEGLPLDLLKFAFGPLLAVMLALWVVFKWLIPKIDAYEASTRVALAEKDKRIAELEEKSERYIRERIDAINTNVAAFEDVALGFESLLADMKLVVKESVDTHDDNAERRVERIIRSLESHAKEIIEKLDGHAKHFRESSGTSG